MKFAKTLFIAILLSTSLISYSQNITETPVKDPSSLIAQINLFSEKTSSISADFTQVKEMSFMEEKVTSTGKFYFRKKKQLRWEYTSPFEYTIILNDGRIRIIDEGKSKDFEAGSNRMFLEISDVMTGLVNGTLLTGTQFSTTWFESKDYYKAVLVPNESMMKEYISRIELKLDKNDYSVDELKMFEKSGDYTQITFHNKKLNENIPDEIFHLD